MTNQQRLEEIEQRLELLGELNKKIDEILKLLEPKKNCELLMSFKPANNNNRDSELKSREREIFQMLDDNIRREK